MKVNSGYMQLAGPTITEYFNAPIAKKISNFFKNPKNKVVNHDISANYEKNNFVNRNFIFYCSEMNRRAGFFRKYEIIKQELNSYSKNITEKIIKNKCLSKLQIDFVFEKVKKIVTNLRKINYEQMIKISCNFDKNAYRALKQLVTKIIKNKEGKDDEKSKKEHKLEKY